MKNNYFTKETENYIVQFNSSSDPVEKQQIFTDHLYYPFYKLAECIIHTFKFYYMDVDSVEDLKLDIIRMIYEEKLDKFDPSKGAKAYSYFGTIIKRFLIAYNYKNYVNKKKTVPLECYRENYTGNITDRLDFEEETEQDRLARFMNWWVQKIEDDLDNLYPEDTIDRTVAEAVIAVFKARSNLEVFQKKALYLYIREITGCETVCLTRVIKALKESFYKEYNRFLTREDLGK